MTHRISIKPFSLKTAFMSLAALACLQSCEQKKLCYDHNHSYNLNVRFDWHKAPTANPSSMYLYLFPHDKENRILKREFIGKEGGTTQMPVEEKYDALCFNSDVRNCLFANTDSKESFEVTTKTVTSIERIGISASSLPRAKGAEQERIIMESDSIWSDHNINPIVMSWEQNEDADVYHLTLYPQRLFCTYKIIINNIKNKNNISTNITATLSGMAGGRYVYSRKKTDEVATVSFPVSMSKDKDAITGIMNCFGNSDAGEKANKLAIYTILKDGNKYYYVYDVTDQVKTAPDPYNVEIQLDTLPIPDEIKDSGGLTPSVNGWKVVDIPIEM